MSRKIREGYRRLMAFVLSMVLVVSNISANTGIVYAAEKEEESDIALFMLDGREILDAIRDLDSQGSFELEDLELEAAQKSVKKSYKKLLEPEKGEVYELTLTVDDRLAPEDTQLMALYRTATEDVVFLFVNESSQAYRFCVNIDGYETKLVKVDPASVYVGEEEEEEEEETAGGTVSRPAGGSAGAGGGASGGSGSAGSSSSGGSSAGGAGSDASDSESVTGGKGSSGSDKSDHIGSDDAAGEDHGSDDASDAGENGGTDDGSASSSGNTGSGASDDGSADKGSAGDGNVGSGSSSGSGSNTSDDGSSSGGSDSGASDSGSSSSGSGSGTSDSGSSSGGSDSGASDSGSSSGGAGSDASDSGSSSGGSGSSDSGSSAGDSAGGASDSGSGADSSSGGAGSDSADSGSRELSISYHQAVFVTVPLEDIQSGDEEDGAAGQEEVGGAEAEETEETTTTEAEDEEEEGTQGTEKEDPEESSPVESEPEGAEKAPAEESTAAPEDPVETSKEEGEGTPEAPEGTSPEESTEEAPEESTKESTEGTAESGSQPEEETTAAAEAESTTAPADTETEEEPDGNGGQDLGDDWEIPGKEYKSVMIWKGAKARAYLVELEEIQKVVEYNEALETLQVDYQVIPDGAAQIVGADTVKMGGTLYFAVEPEEDFEIISVMANGLAVEEVTDVAALAEAEDTEDADEEDGGDTAEEDEAESLADWKKYEHVYKVEAEDEDLVVEVGLDEKLIPAAVYTVETEEAIIRVDVPEGAFEEEVELRAEKIEDEEQLAALIAQTNSLLEEGQMVSEFLAYDVTFASKEDGSEVEPLYTVSVNIQVKKPMTTEEVPKEDALGVSVLHLPEDGDAKIMTSTEKADETEFDFQTQAFSPYGLALVVAGTGNVAKIGDKEYPTLQAAIEASTAGDEIVLLTDTSENIAVTNESKNKSYTLNMQGHTLSSGVVGKNVFEIFGGTVTIQHGTITGGDWGDRTNQDGKAIKASNGVDLTLENCVITNNKGYAKGGISNSGIINIIGGKLTIKDSNITDNVASAGSGGGIYASNCAVSVLGNSSISGNKVTGNYGGAMYINGGSLTIDGGEDRVQISDNSNTSYGAYGSVYVQAAPVTIKKADLTYNALYGIGINNTTQEVHISDVTVTGDNMLAAVNITATTGEVSVENSSFTITNIQNSSNGSAIRLAGIGSTKKIKDCKFLDNTVVSGGTSAMAPIHITAGHADIEGCIFTGNKGFKAGAIYKVGTGTVSIKGCTMNGNEGVSTYGTGAIYAGGNSPITIEDCTIKGNTGTYAGAIYTTQGTMDVIDTVVKENKATNSTAGGGIYVNGGTFRMPVTSEGKNSAIYANNSEKSNANDIYIASVSAKVTVQPATSMKDEGVDFQKFGYVWSNMSSSEITTELTTDSNSLRTWTATPTDRNVARIGDVVYPTFADAMKAVKSNETITLIAGEDGSGSRSLPSGGMYVFGTGTGSAYTYRDVTNVTIDLNGCTIYPTGTASNKTYDASYGIFQVKKSGYVLNIKGPGEIGNRVIVSDGAVLNIEDDAVIKSLGYQNDALYGVQSYGTVNVHGELKTLTARIYQGVMEIAQDAAVGSLTVMEKAARNMTATVNVNGPVEKMILEQSTAEVNKALSTVNINANINDLTLSQSGKRSVAVLDGELGRLYLKHFQNSSTAPVTMAGSGFKVDTLTLRPILGTMNPVANDMADPNKDVPDIAVISAKVGHTLTEDQVNWANASWENQNSTGTNEKGNNTLTWSGDNKDYKFLTSPMLDKEKNQIVLHKTLVNGNYVFIGSNTSSIKPSDSNSGLETSKPVMTFEAAKKVLENNLQLDTIYVLGPITVSKAGETWTLPAGKKIQRYKSYTGPLVKVPSGAALTLEAITIDGGSQSEMKVAATTAMIDVEAGATLNIKEGAVLQNNASGTTDTNNRDQGGAIRNAGKLYMDGGLITGNSSACGGGVFNSGTFVFAGGTISQNKGNGVSKSHGRDENNRPVILNSVNAGGGVFIGSGGRMEMTGGEVIENEAGMGGGISIGDGTSSYTSNTSRLMMTGGTISQNTATNTDRFAGNQAGGGGIFIQMGGVADIEGGHITNNVTLGGYDGGGGIYVNGRVGKGVPKNLPFGQLNLKNVLISENTASGNGGGISVCDTGGVKVYLTDGGVIHGNTGGGKAYDIYLSGKIMDTSGGHGYSFGIIDISRYMLRGGHYKWIDMKTGTLATYSTLRSHNNVQLYSSAKKEELTGLDEIKVYITGNESATRGGGIGANGNVSIGTGNTELTDIQVKKEWTKPNGEPLTGEELKDVSENIWYIYYDLWMKHVKEGDPSVEDEEPTVENGWEKIDTRKETRQFQEPYWNGVTFPNLAIRDDDGEFVYKVREVPDDRFISQVTDNKDGTWTVTNTPAYSLKLSKTLVDGYDAVAKDKVFTFSITLQDAAGPVNATYDAVRTTTPAAEGDSTGATEETVSFVAGKATVGLKDGETIQINGLSPDMTYSVVEELGEEEDDFKVSFDVIWAEKDYEKYEHGSNTTVGDRPLHFGATHVKFTNEVKEPIGDLLISKTVNVDGDGEKDTAAKWHFTLELRDKDDKPLSTSGAYIPYTKTADKIEKGTIRVGSDGVVELVGSVDGFVLGDGESILIENLPAGTKYKVVEKGANTGAYITTVNAGEILVKDDVADVDGDKTDGEEVSEEGHKLIHGSAGVIVKKETAEAAFTNTEHMVTIKGEKIWDDKNDQDGKRPSKIIVELYADNEPLAGEGYRKEVTAKDDWKWEFSGLPKYKDGKLIQYTFSEESVEGAGYSMKEIVQPDDTNDYTGKITNAYTPEETSRLVRKVWEDSADKDGLRPASITVQLLADGSPVGGPIMLNEAGKWQSEWLQLPKYDNGREIVYTIVENTTINGYSVAYAYQEDTKTFVITNTHTPEEPPRTPDEPDRPGSPKVHRDRDPEPPSTTINPGPVPLAAPPQEDNTPLIPIDDESVPLFGMPRTGDRSVSTGALIGMMVVSLMAACGIYIKKRKEE